MAEEGLAETQQHSAPKVMHPTGELDVALHATMEVVLVLRNRLIAITTHSDRVWVTEVPVKPTSSAANIDATNDPPIAEIRDSRQSSLIGLP